MGFGLQLFSGVDDVRIETRLELSGFDASAALKSLGRGISRRRGLVEQGNGRTVRAPVRHGECTR